MLRWKSTIEPKSGLLEYCQGVYRLTPRGRLPGNQVFVRFV